MTKVAFIGLGHMGNPMASRLIQAGLSVSVFDLNAEAVQTLANKGARPAKNLPDAIQEAEVIITMLQTGEQVAAVCLDEHGIFQQAKSGVLYIDSSSIAVEVARDLHKLAKSANIRMLDAPVSGGVAGAEAGSLTIMVGGTSEDFQAAEPILQHLGKNLIHAGPDGNGQAAKICNNMILGISMIAISEAFTLADKLGLNPKTLFEISSKV